MTLRGLGGQGGLGSGKLDVVSGHYVIENASFFVILAQQPEGVQAIREAFPQVTEAHAQLLQSARVTGGRGRGVVVLPDGVFTLRIVPTPVELALLGGS